jgi:hypothetical protein
VPDKKHSAKAQIPVVICFMLFPYQLVTSQPSITYVFVLIYEFPLNISILFVFVYLFILLTFFVPDYSGSGPVSSDKMQKQKQKRGFSIHFRRFHL